MLIDVQSKVKRGGGALALSWKEQNYFNSLSPFIIPTIISQENNIQNVLGNDTSLQLQLSQTFYHITFSRNILS